MTYQILGGLFMSGYRHFEKKDEELSIFSKRIKKLRETHDETQKELAAAISFTKTTIANIEQGKSDPSLEVTTAIAKHYKVSVDYICGLSDDIWGSSAALDTLCRYISLDTENQAMLQTHEIPVISISKGLFDYLNVLVKAGRLKKEGVPDEVIDAWCEKEAEKAKNALRYKKDNSVKYALLSKRQISSDEILALIEKTYRECDGDDGTL